MTIILDRYNPPERGTFQIRESVTINISADEARRKVDNWLLNEVSYMVGADEPDLIIGIRTIWRVPAYFSAPQVGRVDTVGFVEVDVLTGEMISTAMCKVEIEKHAKDLATNLPPYQPRDAPAEDLAENVQPTHRSGRTSGSPRDLISTEE